MFRAFSKRATVLCFWLTLVTLCQLAGAEDKVVLLYPKIDEPYQRIFDEIIKGIDKEATFSIQKKVVEDKYDPTLIAEWTEKQNPDAIIALGQRSFQAIQNIDAEVPMLIGAVINLSKKLESKSIAISYAPNPTIVFSTLKKLTPNIKTVNVVYNPIEMGWLIEIAKEAAIDADIKLNTFEATNFKESAKIYRQILEKMDNKYDALWLLQDNSILDDRVLLPYILEKSWKDNLIIFSSNLSHVKKGALFSLYPDNYNLGIRIGKLINDIKETESFEPNLRPLEDVKLAVNIRTAKHLDLRINYKLRQQFDLIFPRR